MKKRDFVSTLSFLSAPIGTREMFHTFLLFDISMGEFVNMGLRTWDGYRAFKSMIMNQEVKQQCPMAFTHTNTVGIRSYILRLGSGSRRSDPAKKDRIRNNGGRTVKVEEPQ
jgi:hypothetical protein